MTEPTAYRLSEAMAALGIGRTTLYRWIKDGKIEVTRVGTRSFVKRESLKGIRVSIPVSRGDEAKQSGTE
jgi:excisionase family DNA binding protein